MFDWIKKLFGEGTVRFTFKSSDGRNGTGKISYIGEYDEKEVRKAIRNKMIVDHNVDVLSIEIVGHYEK